MLPGFSRTTGGKLEVVVMDVFMYDGLKRLPPVCVHDDDVTRPQAH